jgi:hypothetical protein
VGDGKRIRVKAVIAQELRSNREAGSSLSFSAHSILPGCIIRR